MYILQPMVSDQIRDEKERNERIRAEFTMANHTLCWLSNQGFHDEEYNDAEFLINAA